MGCDEVHTAATQRVMCTWLATACAGGVLVAPHCGADTVSAHPGLFILNNPNDNTSNSSDTVVL